MRIIDRIDNLLKDRGLTSKQLAQDIGVSAGNITDWRKNRSKPSRDVLNKIAKYFGVSLYYLIGDEDINSSDSSLTSKELEILNEMRRSDKKHIKSLASTIDKLLEEGDRLLRIADQISDKNDSEF